MLFMKELDEIKTDIKEDEKQNQFYLIPHLKLLMKTIKKIW